MGGGGRVGILIGIGGGGRVGGLIDDTELFELTMLKSDKVEVSEAVESILERLMSLSAVYPESILQLLLTGFRRTFDPVDPPVVVVVVVVAVCSVRSVP